MTRILGLAGAVCLLLASIATPVAARGLYSHHAKKAYNVGVVLDVGGVDGAAGQEAGIFGPDDPGA